MKTLSGLLVSLSLGLSALCNASDPAPPVQCPPAPTKTVIIKDPPVKSGEKIREVNIWCGDSNVSQTLGQPGPSPGPESPDASMPFRLLDLIVKLLAAIAWPAAAIIIVSFFKKEIAELIPRLKGSKIGPLELSFSEIVDAADAASGIEAGGGKDLVDAASIETARSDPRGAILKAWIDVEAALLRLVQAKHLADGYERISTRSLTSIRIVQNAGLLDAKFVGLFHDLRAARNDAAHASEFNPPADTVIKYVQLAAELTSELRRLASVPS